MKKNQLHFMKQHSQRINNRNFNQKINSVNHTNNQNAVDNDDANVNY